MKRIVIVDDEPKACAGLCRMLTKHYQGEFEIKCFEQSLEAFDYIKKNPTDILLTDIQMNGMNGLALTEALLKLSESPTVIVISAYSDFNYAKKALTLHVVNYLVKPVKKMDLIEAVEEALEQKEQSTRQKLISNYVDEKLIEINQSKAMYSRAIQEAMNYIDVAYKEAITLKEVAAVIHLNASYLSTLFKEELHITFIEYITRVRVQEAKRLLLVSDLNVTEIAEHVGYQTSKYFNKVFREFENTTPGAYRKSMRVSSPDEKETVFEE